MTEVSSSMLTRAGFHGPFMWYGQTSTLWCFLAGRVKESQFIHSFPYSSCPLHPSLDLLLFLPPPLFSSPSPSFSVLRGKSRALFVMGIHTFHPTTAPAHIHSALRIRLLGAIRSSRYLKFYLPDVFCVRGSGRAWWPPGGGVEAWFLGLSPQPATLLSSPLPSHTLLLFYSPSCSSHHFPNFALSAVVSSCVCLPGDFIFSSVSVTSCHVPVSGHLSLASSKYPKNQLRSVTWGVSTPVSGQELFLTDKMNESLGDLETESPDFNKQLWNCFSQAPETFCSVNCQKLLVV